MENRWEWRKACFDKLHSPKGAANEVCFCLLLLLVCCCMLGCVQVQVDMGGLSGNNRPQVDKIVRGVWGIHDEYDTERRSKPIKDQNNNNINGNNNRSNNKGNKN